MKQRGKSSQVFDSTLGTIAPLKTGGQHIMGKSLLLTQMESKSSSNRCKLCFQCTIIIILCGVILSLISLMVSSNSHIKTKKVTPSMRYGHTTNLKMFGSPTNPLSRSNGFNMFNQNYFGNNNNTNNTNNTNSSKAENQNDNHITVSTSDNTNTNTNINTNANTDIDINISINTKKTTTMSPTSSPTNSPTTKKPTMKPTTTTLKPTCKPTHPPHNIDFFSANLLNFSNWVLNHPNDKFPSHWDFNPITQLPNHDDISKMDNGPLNNRCNYTGRVFGIGHLKTGTTSLVSALNRMGYGCYDSSCIHDGMWLYLPDALLGWRPENEIINDILSIPHLYYRMRNISFYGQAFSDGPWVWLYPIFNAWYPNSKYVLTLRQSDYDYINSYLHYNYAQRKEYTYVGLTDEEFGMMSIRRYHRHNIRVIEYFKRMNLMDNLLILSFDNETKIHGNQEGSNILWNKLAKFLGCDGGGKGSGGGDIQTGKSFPHSNPSPKTGSIAIHHTYGLKNDTFDWIKYFGGENIHPYMKRNDSGNKLLYVDLIDKSNDPYYKINLQPYYDFINQTESTFVSFDKLLQ